MEERLLGKVKSAWMIEMWTQEDTLRSIESELDVSPGDVHHRVDLMGWLLAAGQQVLLTDDVLSEEHLPGHRRNCNRNRHVEATCTSWMQE